MLLIYIYCILRNRIGHNTIVVLKSQDRIHETGCKLEKQGKRNDKRKIVIANIVKDWFAVLRKQRFYSNCIICKLLKKLKLKFWRDEV